MIVLASFLCALPKHWVLNQATDIFRTQASTWQD